MTALLPRLVDALRHELQELGETLALLDAQRDPDLRHFSAFGQPAFLTLDGRAQDIETARARRRDLQEQLLQGSDGPAGASLRDLLPRVTDEYRPLLCALIEETDGALLRIREAAEEHQRLLRRCALAMRRFIDRLDPETETAVLPPAPRFTPAPPQTTCDYAVVA